MPAHDVIHNAVKNALIKDGWAITADPFTIIFEEVNVYADLAAERPLAAEREGAKIAVEIKSFLGRSPIHDLEETIGQFALYQGYLELLEPTRKLYVAISESAYTNFFGRKAFQVIIERYHVPLIVVNLQEEKIALWTG
jgi:hypothetical protein